MRSKKFIVMWNNDTSDFRRNMSQHHITLRGENVSVSEVQQGLTCKALYLDQVFVVFRPTNNIQATEFVSGDSSNLNFRAETMQLLVKTQPGFSHVMYLVPGNTADHLQTGLAPVRRLLYSNAFAVTPDIEGAEDYWCRTYRPVRDNPIAVDLQNVSDLSMDLLFPLLTDATWGHHIPNYRVLTVMCEFSVADDDAV